MTKVEILKRSTSIDELDEMMKAGRVFVTPFNLNRSVYIIQRGKPQNVMVTDVSLKGIQLNGSWMTWEELDKNGGIYGSEFEALSSIHK